MSAAEVIEHPSVNKITISGVLKSEVSTGANSQNMEVSSNDLFKKLSNDIKQVSIG
jgi:hypothetical protein